MNSLKLSAGFTIVETLIVLAIAALILVAILIAVPDLQRSSRNHARRQDANLLVSAVNQCLAANANNTQPCKLTTNIDLPVSEIPEMTGFLYGSCGAVGDPIEPYSCSTCGNSEYTTPPVPVLPQCAPSYDEMNYLFDLKCTGSTTYSISNAQVEFVVTYRYETGSGWQNFCVNG